MTAIEFQRVSLAFYTWRASIKARRTKAYYRRIQWRKT